MAETLTKQEYDPHILYNAINLTVELEYKVPMQKIYNILAMIEKKKKDDSDGVTPKDVLSLLKQMGEQLEKTILTDNPYAGDSLQSKIKELLRLLGCSLSNQELNQILKGELSLDDVLSKEAKAAWLIIFDQNEQGHFRPNKEIVEQMLLCIQSIAIETVDLKIQRSMENYRIQEKSRTQNEMLLKQSDNMKVLYRTKEEKEREDPVMLDRKRAKLKLYIAHMQGYDRDLDRDGGRGINMTTGEVIDYEDIYLADKMHGSVMEDIERDGIDIEDIH